MQHEVRERVLTSLMPMGPLIETEAASSTGSELQCQTEKPSVETPVPAAPTLRGLDRKPGSPHLKELENSAGKAAQSVDFHNRLICTAD